MSTEEGLSPKDFRDAILVQDACNLSGVVHSFSRIMTRVWIEARKRGKGTDWVNEHPICVLFANKIANLTGQCLLGGTEFYQAYDICKAESEKCT